MRSSLIPSPTGAASPACPKARRSRRDGINARACSSLSLVRHRRNCSVCFSSSAGQCSQLTTDRQGKPTAPPPARGSRRSGCSIISSKRTSHAAERGKCRFYCWPLRHTARGTRTPKAAFISWCLLPDAFGLCGNPAGECCGHCRVFPGSRVRLAVRAVLRPAGHPGRVAGGMTNGVDDNLHLRGFIENKIGIG